MSSVGATIHPVVAAAAEGVLPRWATAGKARRRHMKRVARLLDAWGRARALDDASLARWRAAAHLHDALKGSDPEALRSDLSGAFADMPGALLHGPAAALRLECDGVVDPELVDAVRYHTLGHPSFADLREALFMADYLEPGRKSRRKWRARLRARAASEPGAVLRIVVRERIRLAIDRHRPLHDDTTRFWNRIVDGAR